MLDSDLFSVCVLGSIWNPGDGPETRNEFGRGGHLTLGNIFHHAQSTPQKTAILYRDYRISYGEFAYWIATARQFLGQQELRPGSVAVMVSVPCRLDAWALDFALRSLGLHTIAVRTPDDLHELNLRNVGCVITTLPEQSMPIPVGDDGYRLIRIPQPLYLGQRAGAVPESPHTTHPEGGHMMLTSGTTGARKKVMISAGSLAIRTMRQGDIYGISEDSVVHIFDFAMWTGAGYKLPFSVWDRGAAIIFHQNENPHLSLRVDRITHAIISPARLMDVLNAPAGEIPYHPEMLLSAAGAPLTQSLADAARAQLTPNIHASLASTEVGIWGLTRIDSPDDLRAHKIHPSIAVQVVDDGDRPLPRGQVGVIRVQAADGVSGYLDDEAASRKIFRQGFFYPGDLGEFREDDRLVLHGRTSSVILVRGNKFMAEPIESRLQEALGVDAVCLISMSGEGANDELHVVVQSRPGIGAADVSAAMTQVCPGAPGTRIHFVQQMSRNDMGKIDRISLRRHIAAMVAAC
jgi:acyl-CoA synthetase (AMP-forming)/AMP-acid ligase II